MKSGSFRVAKLQSAATEFLLVLGIVILTACATPSPAGNGPRGEATP